MTELIERSLSRCNAFLTRTDWRGRENELVNLFAHHCLAPEIREDGILRSFDQVGIEVAVPQVTGSRKKLVRKDLVIWPEPLMTVWTGMPAAIVEWKRNDSSECAGDVEWLKLFTNRFPGTVGYAVCGFVEGNRGIEFTKITKGRAHKFVSLRP